MLVFLIVKCKIYTKQIFLRVLNILEIKRKRRRFQREGLNSVFLKLYIFYALKV